MKISWGALFFMVLVACSPSTVAATQSKAARIIPTNTPTALSIPTSKIIPSPTTPPPTAITPTIKTIAPVSREVELSDLELNDSTRLILYYEPSDSLRIMASQDIRPQRIPISNPQSIINYGLEISPNHKWFAYNVFKEKRDDVAYYDIWISSIDGKQQELAVSDVRGATGTRWVTDERLELWYYPYPRQCPERELVVNPFTHEILNPPIIPRLTEPDCFFDLVTSPNHSQILYRSPADNVWNIYDFNTGKSQNVFPWLSKAEGSALWTRHIEWSINGITLAIPRQQSVDFIVDLPRSDVSESNVALKRVLLPDGKKLYNETFSWWALDEGFVGFDLVQSDFSYAESGDETPLSNFVILDLKHSILYDYNLDRARIGDMQKVSDYFVQASADNRFLAWTIYSPPGMGNPIETVVLDRQTGQIAHLKGFEFFGWGEVDQP